MNQVIALISDLTEVSSEPKGGAEVIETIGRLKRQQSVPFCSATVKHIGADRSDRVMWGVQWKNLNGQKK
jgi:hypothetical protein